MDARVLIVGAGPSGLALALFLSKFGVPLRIIDKASGPGQTSRAMVVQARTLEFYQQLGFADEVVAKGINVENLSVRSNGNLAATIALGPLGKNLSPFPFVLSLPQDEHEKILIEQLLKAGVSVERDTELLSFTQDADSVSATLKKGDQTETFKTPYLFGCDGAHSVARTESNIGFPGGTYSQIFYVADVIAKGEVVNGFVQICMNEEGFSLVFPIRSSGSVRLIGIVPKEKENKENLEFSDVAPDAIRFARIEISQVNWFSFYHLHHRVAEHFRKGRVFLLGDAGHIHSPVAGQGMNTGIGDAVNLAWKVAAVLQDRAEPSLLDSYEVERIRFAHQLIRTTDKAFQAVTNEGLWGKFVRDWFFPKIFPFLIRFDSVKTFFFKTVSQIKINYRHSTLSKGVAGKVQGGDRLPWVRYEGGDNFKLLQSLDWQLHIYGEAMSEFQASIAKLGLDLHVLPWSEMASMAGLEENAVYLIRPDGYVAFACAFQDAKQIESYLVTN